jgi:hypothetical protein
VSRVFIMISLRRNDPNGLIGLVIELNLQLPFCAGRLSLLITPTSNHMTGPSGGQLLQP